MLRAGPGPYPWREPGRIAASFVTDSPRVVSLIAMARVLGHPEQDARIEWEVAVPSGFKPVEVLRLRGPTLTLRLSRES